MSDKCNCQPYEVDYKQIVHEIIEALWERSKDLKNQLKDEKNPIRYIEQKAILNDVESLRETIFRMHDYCRKPMDEGVGYKPIDEGEECEPKV